MKTSSQFYKEFGAKKLALRKTEAHTKKELSYLKKYLKKNQKILDLACGYGRFTIPLAKQGYAIEGVDISPNLLNEAKKRAKKQKVNIKFKWGDMRKLPYTENNFDSIICMWSAFIELSKEKDQLQALREMLRVLKKGGFAFLEMPALKNIKKKISVDLIDGVEAVPMYHQDKNSLKKLMKIVKPKKYKIFVDEFGGRNRLLFIFWK